jgi:endonuclease YncB( thermonuclease family)
MSDKITPAGCGWAGRNACEVLKQKILRSHLAPARLWINGIHGIDAIQSVIFHTVLYENRSLGKARVIDGDTIEIGSERVRLHGIDAPEVRQTCIAYEKQWACGREATFALAFEVGHHWVTCRGDKRDRYGRLIAVCYVGPYDLGKRMVRDRWALAYRRYSMDYVNDEVAARQARRGMWRGEFVPPWEWRKGYR